jgi:hypothetical protein
VAVRLMVVLEIENLIWLPHWTRFELLQPETHALIQTGHAGTILIEPSRLTEGTPRRTRHNEPEV